MKYPGIVLIALAFCLALPAHAGNNLNPPPVPVPAQSVEGGDLQQEVRGSQEASRGTAYSESGSSRADERGNQQQPPPARAHAGAPSATLINPLRTGPFNAATPGVHLPMVYGAPAPVPLPATGR